MMICWSIVVFVNIVHYKLSTNWELSVYKLFLHLKFDLENSSFRFGEKYVAKLKYSEDAQHLKATQVNASCKAYAVS